MTSPLSLNKTIEWDFNCGGFAFDTLEWYCPNDWFDITESEDPEPDFVSVEELEADIDLLVSNILDDFPEYVQVESYRNIPKRFRVVGFRIMDSVITSNYAAYDSSYSHSYYGDFHFICRENGKWYHKAGHEYIKYFNTREIHAETWSGKYNTRTIWFAKLKKEA